MMSQIYFIAFRRIECFFMSCKYDNSPDMMTGYIIICITYFIISWQEIINTVQIYIIFYKSELFYCFFSKKITKF